MITTQATAPATYTEALSRGGALVGEMRVLLAAWQPGRAWGLLPVVAALALVLGGTAVLDVVRGTATSLGETHHALDLAGVAVLWLVAREERTASLPRRLTTA